MGLRFRKETDTCHQTNLYMESTKDEAGSERQAEKRSREQQPGTEKNLRESGPVNFR